jgi:hypothetical protein
MSETAGTAETSVRNNSELLFRYSSTVNFPAPVQSFQIIFSLFVRLIPILLFLFKFLLIVVRGVYCTDSGQAVPLSFDHKPCQVSYVGAHYYG